MVSSGGATGVPGVGEGRGSACHQTTDSLRADGDRVGIVAEGYSDVCREILVPHVLYCHAYVDHVTLDNRGGGADCGNGDVSDWGWRPTSHITGSVTAHVHGVGKDNRLGNPVGVVEGGEPAGISLLNTGGYQGVPDGVHLVRVCGAAVFGDIETYGPSHMGRSHTGSADGVGSPIFPG